MRARAITASEREGRRESRRVRACADPAADSARRRADACDQVPAVRAAKTAGYCFTESQAAAVVKVLSVEAFGQWCDPRVIASLRTAVRPRIPTLFPARSVALLYSLVTIALVDVSHAFSREEGLLLDDLRMRFWDDGVGPRGLKVRGEAQRAGVRPRDVAVRQSFRSSPGGQR